LDEQICLPLREGRPKKRTENLQAAVLSVEDSEHTVALVGVFGHGASAAQLENSEILFVLVPVT